MVKHESISSDINFIKEFEELKLKQKLLVESLKHKKKIKDEGALVDLNAKLDFLVKIFKEVQETEEEETKLDEAINKIIARIDEMDEKYNEKFKIIEKNLGSFEKEIKSEVRTSELNKEILGDIKN